MSVFGGNDVEPLYPLGTFTNPDMMLVQVKQRIEALEQLKKQLETPRPR